MKLRRLVLLAGMSLALAARGLADDTKPDAWPEPDAYGLSDKSRLFLSAAMSRSRQEDYADLTLGAHVDSFLKPISRAWLRHTPDVEKQGYLSFRIGYRYGQGLGDDADSYREQRVVLEGTARAYLPGRLVALNATASTCATSRAKAPWRYRNRTRLEREFPAWSRSLTA